MKQTETIIEEIDKLIKNEPHEEPAEEEMGSLGIPKTSEKHSDIINYNLRRGQGR